MGRDNFLSGKSCDSPEAFWAEAGPAPWDGSKEPFEMAEGASSMDGEITELLERNRVWAKNIQDINSEFFESIHKEQKPDYLWIGCSDSRVPAEQVLGLLPGKLFVHRNIANLIPNQDVNVHSVLNYAVGVLKVRHILVCGHYNCGGVKAAMGKSENGFIDHWLRNIRDVYRLHKKELDGIECPEERYRRLVELNVIEQCVNVFKTGIVQQTRLANVQDPAIGHAFPRIHPLVFDPRDGKVTKLDVNWESIVPALRDVYNLFETKPTI